MSEFSDSECIEWIKLSCDKNCSIYDAIRYTFFFENDLNKSMRAYRYCRDYLGIGNYIED